MSDRPDLYTSAGFDALYGLEILELTAERGRAQLPVRDHHRQPFGLVHGGVLAAIAESVASLATAAGVIGEDRIGTGLSNQTSFLRPITEGTIHALATRRHAGRTTWVWEVELADDHARLCAISRVTLAIGEAPSAATPIAPPTGS